MPLRPPLPDKQVDPDNFLHVLVVEDQKGRRPIGLDAVTFSLGRDPSNGIVLHGSSISRQHAILLRLPNPKGGYLFRLLDGNSQGRPSRNGTFINGKKCHPSRDLQDGDELLFGNDVTAHYYVRSPEDGNFAEYLQKVGYHSVKAAISDPRATIMNPVEVEDITQVGSSPRIIPPQALVPSARNKNSFGVWRWLRRLWKGSRP